MSELPEYVLENFAPAVKQDLGTWLLNNPLPTICERKYDGIRVFLFKSGDKLVLSSKHGGVYTPKSSPKVFATFTELLHAPNRMILDGEYVSRDPGKRGLFFFDVLHVDDRDVRSLVLRDRKKILHEILDGTGAEVPFKLAKTAQQILDFKDRFAKEGYEGVVAKNPLSTYGEPGSWLKLKKFETIDVFVIDYERTQEMERTGVPRSWVVGVYDDEGRRVPMGKVGAFVEKVDPSKVKRGSVIEVRFQQVTEDNKLRGAVILRVRHDKLPNECLFSQVR